MNSDESKQTQIEQLVAKLKCEDDHLFFTRYFFKARQSIKFRVNWHHELIADTIQKVIDGEIKNLVINVSPGASKTEIVVINLIARGLALNPRARFLHLSGSDSLASLNSATARDLILSDEYQKFWPLKIAVDSKAKKRWNVLVDGKPAGGVYATALGGQVTGFRAGHMAEGFQGAIIIDDPIKPEDAYSKVKLDAANRTLVTTVTSRKATPDTPIIVVMQRLAENDPTGFIDRGNVEGDWTFVNIPALIDEKTKARFEKKYQDKMDQTIKDPQGRFSYWAYKEPISKLLRLERGDGEDANGSKVSRHVFNSQYQQTPVALGGNVIKGEYLVRYKTAPKIKYRVIFADTAQKTKEHNDYSVFICVGYGDDGKLYLLDLIRGKWEAPELQKRAVAFWNKHKAADIDVWGALRNMVVEDKSSGTGLIQTIKLHPYNIPVKGIERSKDKLTRVMDGLPYIEAGQFCIPEDAPFTNDFVAECESFSADDTHDFDDQVDPMLDAIDNLLSNKNKMKQWEQLAPGN